MLSDYWFEPIVFYILLLISTVDLILVPVESMGVFLLISAGALFGSMAVDWALLDLLEYIFFSN